MPLNSCQPASLEKIPITKLHLVAALFCASADAHTVSQCFPWSLNSPWHGQLPLAHCCLKRGIFSSLRGVISCLDPAQTKLSPLHLCDIFYIRSFDLSSTLSFSQIHFKKNIHFLKNILIQLDLFQVIVYFY